MNSRASRPMSPCVNICTLDDEHVCMGCLRCLEEIIAWGHDERRGAVGAGR